VPAVHDVSLTVEEGEIFALLGPKGAALGLRSVFLPEAFAAQEPGANWQTAKTAIVMVIWCVVGLTVTRRTFTWMSERER
jgi:ABC-2 type transport system permease protein